MLAAECKRSVATAECCCAYNMLKLARHLYSWNPTRATSITTSARCSITGIGTIQPKTGYTQYYLSLTPGAWKTFNTEDKSFWCCTGTGVEEYSKLNDSIYWRDGEACTSTSSFLRNWTGRRRASSCGRKQNFPSSRPPR